MPSYPVSIFMWTPDGLWRNETAEATCEMACLRLLLTDGSFRDLPYNSVTVSLGGKEGDEIIFESAAWTGVRIFPKNRRLEKAL